MGDMGDLYRDLRDHKRAVRQRYGVPCPKCQEEQPRRAPTILLPGALCRVHRPGYRDPRPPLTDEQWANPQAEPEHVCPADLPGGWCIDCIPF